MVMYLGQVVEVGPAQALFDRPAHPYTKALLSSIPAMDPDQRTQQAAISGDPPNPINPPPGCRFHTRCPQAREVCAQRMPALGNAWGGHPVACLMYEKDSAYDASPALALAQLAQGVPA
jgi:peptide/nickel transport system ATP-binding protein